MPNSHGRRVWFLALTSLKVKVKGQTSRSPGTKNGILGPFGGLLAVYVYIYTVGHKKEANLFSSVTLSKINGF